MIKVKAGDPNLLRRKLFIETLALLKELDDNFSAMVNSRSAIEVTVYDHDKQFAADMANEIVRWVNEQSTKLLNENKTQSMANTGLGIGVRPLNTLHIILHRYVLNSYRPNAVVQHFQISMQLISICISKSQQS